MLISEVREKYKVLSVIPTSGDEYGGVICLYNTNNGERFYCFLSENFLIIIKTELIFEEELINLKDSKFNYNLLTTVPLEFENVLELCEAANECQQNITIKVEG